MSYDVHSNNVGTDDTAVCVTIDKEEVKAQIFIIRGMRVMLDSDIATYFGTETGALNRAMKRNKKRFPISFCFQMTKEELENLKCQSGISSGFESYGGRRTLPFVYSEQGVAMLTSVLHTDRAIDASIQIIEAFVEMTHYLRHHQQLIPYQGLHFLSVRQDRLENSIEMIAENMVTKEDLSEFMKLFDQSLDNEEILLFH